MCLFLYLLCYVKCSYNFSVMLKIILKNKNYVLSIFTSYLCKQVDIIVSKNQSLKYYSYLVQSLFIVYNDTVLQF